MVDSAELFEAISHPVRIKILKILEKQPSSFASLKRQLGIDSSGNLDHHLKKLAELVAVRADGLYGLTNAGKEALSSIEAVETWVETEERKVKVSSQMPKEALFLGSFELFITVSILWFFLAVAQVRPFWGYFVSAVFLLLGAYSTVGIFTQQKWSWKAILVKSALVMSMSLFLANYLVRPTTMEQAVSAAVSYGMLIAAEAVAVMVALRHPVKDFLGVRNVKLSTCAIVASLMSMFSGILLVTLQNAQPFGDGSGTVFNSFIGDTTILCGLAIWVGGVLILLGSYAIGGVISIVFGLYPPPEYGLHLFNLIKVNYALPEPYGFMTLPIAVAAGALPFVAGLLALASAWKIRR